MEIDVIEPDYYYHIYNRGINRQPIFSDQNHYYKFLMLCIKYITSQADVLSYCLIPNHFHFLVYFHPDIDWHTKPSGNSPLNQLFNSYAQWFNKRTDRTGGLFQSPFKRKRILDQEYLKQAIYYIHRNPMHHKITRKPDEYVYSSYNDLIGNNPTFVKRDHVLQWFDGPVHFADYHKMKFEIDEREFFDEE
ncbi:MAG TPA: transposase [Bacteroidales bacterium]|jgi:REP element-mobilizing transposase RayT|nr:transposase [Bacteroidales bacterium]